MSKDSVVLDKLETAFTLILSSLKEIRASEDWVDQYHSPLGKTAHLAAVRRGDLDGHKVPGSRSVFVRRADLDKYLASHRVKAKSIKVEGGDVKDEAAEIAEVVAHRTTRRRRPAA